MDKEKLTDNIRFRCAPELKAAFEKMLEGRKISQQDACNALFGWVVKQDPLVQAMVLGQVPADDEGELIKLVLKRLASGKRDGPKGAKGR